MPQVVLVIVQDFILGLGLLQVLVWGWSKGVGPRAGTLHKKTDVEPERQPIQEDRNLQRNLRRMAKP